MNRARADVLARLLIALVRQATVTLSKLALVLNPAVQVRSNERRLQRFFAQIRIPIAARVALILHWLAGDISCAPIGSGSCPQRVYILSIDRTEWTFGQLHVNVLMVALCLGPIAVPIAWTILPDTQGRFGPGGSKHGISNSAERIDLMRTVLAVLPAPQIRVLLGDREFVSRTWLTFLDREQIPFVMRAKGTIRMSVRGRGVSRRKAPATALGPGTAPLQAVLGGIPPGTVSWARKRRQVCGVRMWVAVIGHRTDPIFLLSALPPSDAARLYADRWQIETLFRALKSQGFDLATTHLRDPERISALIGVLSLAFVWAYKVGEWSALQRPPRMHLRPETRAHRPNGWRAVPHRSTFRRGVDTIQMHFARPGATVDPLLHCLREIILSGT